MRRTLITAAATALLHAGRACAADPVAPAEESGSSYTYVDAMGFAIEGGGEAATLRGSLALGGSDFYATAGRYALSTDEGRSRITSLGVGYHHAVAETTDLVLEVVQDRHRWDGGAGRQLSAAVGATHAFTETLEASLLLTRYFADGDLPAAGTVYVGGQRMLTANLALVVDAEFGEGPAWYGMGLRYFIH